MTGVGLAATGYIKSDHVKKGNPEVLFNGMDYIGNICMCMKIPRQHYILIAISSFVIQLCILKAVSRTTQMQVMEIL